MKRCHNCQKEVRLVDGPGPEERCPHCEKPLHCCFNCHFYSPSAPKQCSKETLPFIDNKRSANTCESFRFREIELQHKDTGQVAAKKRLDDLFGGL